MATHVALLRGINLGGRNKVAMADLRDVAALAPLGVEGAIVGKALYAGKFTLEQALAAVSG